MKETEKITIRESPLTDELTGKLIALSEEWESEGSCHGYRKNGVGDIAGNRVFTAVCGEEIVGYLFGHMERTERATSITEKGTTYFEIEEIYVKPAWRSRGIGAKLFRLAEDAMRGEAEVLFLSTASKNWRAILHFYIDELDMEFWNARLYKRLTISEKGETT